MVAQLLAAKPSLIDAKTFHHFTALHEAARAGHEGVMAQLLTAKPSQRAAHFTALHFAAHHGRAGVVAQCLLPNLL